MANTSGDDNPSGSAPERTEVLPPERLVAGKYELGRMLGEGGMGAVYEAEHTGLGTRVAVKLLSERFANDPKSLTRFRREARAAAAVRHENVVQVTDTGTDEDGVPFIVMELLRGESLSAVLHRHRVLPPETAAGITTQILSGSRWPTRRASSTVISSPATCSSRPTRTAPSASRCWTSASPSSPPSTAPWT